MTSKSICQSLRLAIPLLSAGFIAGTAVAGTVTETFDTQASAIAHGWTSSGNNTGSNNFGFSSTSNVLGTGGEAGGTFARARNLCYYADTDLGGSFKRTDSFTFSGSMKLSNTNFDGNMFVGFFDSTNLNPASTSFIGCFIGEPSSDSAGPFRLSAQVRAGATATGSSLIEVSQNTTITFNLSWAGSPSGAGVLSGTINGTAVNLAQGAGSGNFNAFGVGTGFNTDTSQVADAYFDSLTYSTNPPPPKGLAIETFDDAASTIANGWVGSENTIAGCNFGFSATSNVLGTGHAGEAGGIFARSNAIRYYADKTLDGVFSRADSFSFSGSMKLNNDNFDGNVFIGFFDSTSTSSPSFIGLWIGEPASSGGPSGPFRVTAQIHKSDNTGTGSAFYYVPQDTTVTFNLSWTAQPDGSGKLTGTVNGAAVNISQGAASGSFDAFGIGTGFANSEIDTLISAGTYFDDLTYSTYVEPAVPIVSIETFDTADSAAANGWTMLGNTSDGNNFGFSPTDNVAAGEGGEAGGTFARTVDIHYYADTDLGGTFHRSDTFSFSGSAYLDNLETGGFNGQFFVGFFDQNDLATSAEDNASLVGIWFSEPQFAWSDPFRAASVLVSSSGVPAHIAHYAGSIDQLSTIGFSLTWAGNPDGSGVLTGTINGSPVAISQGAGEGAFNAFGIGSGFCGGNDSAAKTAGCYFDNFTYSRIAPVEESFRVLAYTYDANAGQSTLTFTSTPGIAYQIWQSATLSGWVKIKDVNGAAAATETTVVIPEAEYSGPLPKSFFRVIRP